MDNRFSKITIVLLVLSFIMTAIGGTFAWLSASANITNGTYTAMTHCFLVDYNIDNGDGTQDITGTMFPSANALGGLNGRVGLKINDSCELYGTGTLKLHINSETSSALTNNVASYCESRKTLEKIDGITTKEACTTANGRWMGYGDSYCENPNTLERLKDYTTESDCTNNGGSWTTGGSPLKYAVYNTEDITQFPISVGHITSNDIGHDITIKDDILVSKTQKYFYIYVWLDGYMTDNTFTDLAFSGLVSASAIQNNNAVPSEYQRVEFLKATGTQYIDTKLNGFQEFDIDFQADNTEDVSYFFGHREAGSLHRFALMKYNSIFHFMTGEHSFWNKSFDTDRHYIQLRRNNANIDGNNYNYSWGNGDAGNTYNFLLFASYQYSSIKGNNGMKLFSAKFYNDIKLIREYIPCYNKTTLERGLYDTVTDVFYTNAGIGTFEIGPEM